MLVGIHPKHNGYSESLVKYEKILDHNKIPHIRLNSNEEDFWEKIRTLDLFIYRIEHMDAYKDRSAAILPVVENHYGIKTLPNYNTAWHYDDKIKQFYMLKAHGFPVCDSWVFWDKKEALAFTQKTAYPIIFKLKGGAGSSSVIMVKNQAQAERLVNRMFGAGMLTGNIPSLNTTRFTQFNWRKEVKRIGKPIINAFTGKYPPQYWLLHKNYVYFQKFYPRNEWDTRVTTIGNRVYGFRRFVRKNDFRASGSDNWSVDRDQIDPRFLQIGLEISRKLGFQVMAYDFIYDEQKQPRLIEISYTYGDYPEFHNGYWDEHLNWVAGEYNTQYLELVDALGRNDLKYLPLAPIGHYSKVKF